MKFGNWILEEDGNSIIIRHEKDNTAICLYKDAVRGTFHVKDTTLYGDDLLLTYIRADYVHMRNFGTGAGVWVDLFGKRLTIRTENVERVDVEEVTE